MLTYLEPDFRHYRAKAAVIEPVPGPPCYVFRPLAEWRQFFPTTLIATDTKTLLAQMQDACAGCGETARFVWIAGKRFNEDNFEDVLKKGLFATLLREGHINPESLCARCCLQRIKGALERQDISYLEVCGPKGEDGFMIPMGY